MSTNDSNQNDHETNNEIKLDEPVEIEIKTEIIVNENIDKNPLETVQNDKKIIEDKYPKHVFLILLNEFCERFSYYGLRTVLFIYLTSFIKLESDTATAIYHSFNVLCYFTPIFGAIIADGYLGLYKTILYVSIIYCIGEICLTLTSMIPLGAPNIAGPVVSLIIIAIGTGGIKPCVNAFGGNQFKPSQKKYLDTYFSIFYLSINLGSFFGTILTPIFRSDVKCFGEDCYPLAFGIPAIFFIISVIIFVIGTPFYNRDDEKTKNGKNIITQTIGCIYEGLKNKIRLRKSVKKDHWLDYAETEYSHKMINDVKAFIDILVLYLPLPIYWALNDQQGSTWTAQAQQLSGILGSVTIKPDQLQAVNSFLVVTLAPIFNFIIYPLLSKFNLLKTPLKKMSVGLIITIFSFITAAILESEMQKASAVLNTNDRIRIVNFSPCNISFYQMNSSKNSQAIFYIQKPVYLNNKAYDFPKDIVNFIKANNETQFKIEASCTNQFKTIENKLTINNLKLPKTIFLFLENNQINSLEYPYDNLNQLIGFSELKIGLFNTETFGKLYPSLSNKLIMYDSTEFELTDIESFDSSDSIYTTIYYDEYTFLVENIKDEILLKKDILLETCARYTIVLFPNMNSNITKLDFIQLTDIYQNGLHMLWQLIQIFIISVGEVMYVVNGLSFTYSQAPYTMKSVFQALWLLTISFGNLFVAIYYEISFLKNQVYIYLIFSAFLTISTIAFIILASFYEYKEQTHIPYDSLNEEKSDNYDPIMRNNSSKDLTQSSVTITPDY